MAEAARLLDRLRFLGVGGVMRRVRFRAGKRARRERELRWEETAAKARAGAQGAAHPEALLDGAFFLDARDRDLAKRFRERHADACDAIVAQAERALRGDLGFVVPGGTSDWHRALPGDARWPLEPRAPLERAIGAEQPVGDVRLAWEVGRCTHLVRLAQAAWLTEERRFAEGARAGLFDFAAANPPGTGIAWLHAQEVALRAIHWLWTLHLLRGAGALDAETAALAARELALHGAFVDAFRSDGPATHNHLVSEAAGLLVLGTASPRLPGATRWRRTGAQLLRREIRKQTYPEGPTGEGSTHYHAFVLDSCVAALLLAERGGPAFPDAAAARVARMAGYVHALIRDDGTLPAIGDSDGGRGWRLGTDPGDRRDLLAAAAVWRRRADWGAAAGDAPGAFWLTGGRTVPGAAAARPPGGAAMFRDAGVAVARTARGAREEVAIFRAGPARFLPDVLDAHHHADALSVLLRAGGEDVLVDPGSYLYSEGAGWRAELRGTRSHSSVVAGGRDQADVRWARFGIAGLRPARWVQADGGAGFLAACAEHTGQRGPRLRRSVAWLAGGVVACCDGAPDGAPEEVAAWLQLPHAEGEADGRVAVLRLRSGRVVRIEAFGARAELAIVRPSDAPGPGWRAPRYGMLERGTAVRASVASLSPSERLLTVVQTLPGGERPRDPAVRRDPGGDWEVRVGDATFRFADDGRVRLAGAGAPPGAGES